MSQPLNGRAAIVTGAGRGIGRDIALLLASQGAAVVVVDPGAGRTGEATNERPADEVLAEIRKAGGTAIASFDSVMDYKASGAIVEQCVKEFGSVDLVVNAAGVLRERMIWNMTEEDFDLVIGVHLKGHWNMAHHAIKHMRVNGFGRIVNFSSDAFKGSPGQCNYVAAKAGIIGLTRAIAAETAKYGITANAICPVANTRMTMTEEVEINRQRALKDGRITQAEYDRIKVGRGPEHIAPLAAYLCMNEADWINGQIIHIQHGQLASYYFGEFMHKHVNAADDMSQFSIDQLRALLPELLQGTSKVAPVVRYGEAQKAVVRK